MKRLLPLILLLVGLGGGIAAGAWIGPAKPKDIGQSTTQNTAAKGKKVNSKGQESDGHSENNGETLYLKMSRNFVVPLVHQNQISGLATVSLSLEMKTGANDAFYAREPKLRDGFLQVLFDHANIGGFDGVFTQPKNLDPLRRALLQVARAELGDEVHAVLITDIARQDAY